MSEFNTEKYVERAIEVVKNSIEKFNDLSKEIAAKIPDGVDVNIRIAKPAQNNISTYVNQYKEIIQSDIPESDDKIQSEAIPLITIEPAGNGIILDYYSPTLDNTLVRTENAFDTIHKNINVIQEAVNTHGLEKVIDAAYVMGVEHGTQQLEQLLNRSFSNYLCAAQETVLDSVVEVNSEYDTNK